MDSSGIDTKYLNQHLKFTVILSRADLYQFKAAAVKSACPAKSAGARAWSTDQLKKEWDAITLEHAASFLSSLFSSLS